MKAPWVAVQVYRKAVVLGLSLELELELEFEFELLVCMMK
jgi:hypothetical protein